MVGSIFTFGVDCHAGRGVWWRPGTIVSAKATAARSAVLTSEVGSDPPETSSSGPVPLHYRTLDTSVSRSRRRDGCCPHGPRASIRELAARAPLRSGPRGRRPPSWRRPPAPLVGHGRSQRRASAAFSSYLLRRSSGKWGRLAARAARCVDGRSADPAGRRRKALSVPSGCRTVVCSTPKCSSSSTASWRSSRAWPVLRVPPEKP